MFQRRRAVSANDRLGLFLWHVSTFLKKTKTLCSNSYGCKRQFEKRIVTAFNDACLSRIFILDTTALVPANIKILLNQRTYKRAKLRPYIHSLVKPKIHIGLQILSN